MDPILATLAAKGLSLIGSAVLTKWKDFNKKTPVLIVDTGEISWLKLPP